ncbi:malonate transporter subunit L [Burkholderia pseudomallei MSHR1043]|nr:malonate transporter subunit L [Burkholderia pseudomallei MSHR1043]
MLNPLNRIRQLHKWPRAAGLRCAWPAPSRDAGGARRRRPRRRQSTASRRGGPSVLHAIADVPPSPPENALRTTSRRAAARAIHHQESGDKHDHLRNRAARVLPSGRAFPRRSTGRRDRREDQRRRRRHRDAAPHRPAARAASPRLAAEGDRSGHRVLGGDVHPGRRRDGGQSERRRRVEGRPRRAAVGGGRGCRVRAEHRGARARGPRRDIARGAAAARSELTGRRP